MGTMGILLLQVPAPTGPAAKAPGHAVRPGPAVVPVPHRCASPLCDCPPAEVAQLLATFDVDSGGNVDYDEWLAALIDWREVGRTPANASIYTAYAGSFLSVLVARREGGAGWGPEKLAVERPHGAARPEVGERTWDRCVSAASASTLDRLRDWWCACPAVLCLSIVGAAHTHSCQWVQH